jgi:4-hydroxythreonine-4-phosphate dehydrogenase
MLTSPEISCLLVTIHKPLADVASLLTEEAIYESILLAAEAIGRRTWRQSHQPPRISVLGLNPHAGEHGLMSHLEEERLIQPAIDRARQKGLDIAGPLPPDTAFIPAWRQRTDVYVCMYHDQGLIPLKALAFDEGVNVTLGLPIVRTSVDHGTAMDLAWQGVADHRSLLAAVQMAEQLC